MRKRMSIYRLGAYAAGYIVLALVALVHYYVHYLLLQSGLVIAEMFEYWVGPLFVIFWVMLRRWDRWFLALVFTVLSLPLLLGLIPFVNRMKGRARVISGRVEEVWVSRGRGGGNKQYYFRVRNDSTGERVTLRSADDVLGGRGEGSEVRLGMKVGMLGVLYEEYGRWGEPNGQIGL